MDNLLKQLDSFGFAEPIWLWLLLAVPAVAWLLGRPAKNDGVMYSSANLLAEVSKQMPDRWRALRFVMPLIAIALVAIAIARPRIEKGEQTDRQQGIDMVLVLDMSASMDAEDFLLRGKPATRLDGLVDVTNNFIENRDSDRIGVVGFAAEPYLIAPLTLDHSWVARSLEETSTANGTAIGSAMVAASEMLARSDTKTKIQIVITDGLNNKGVPPIEAAKIAAAADTRIYPIEILHYSKIRTDKVNKHPLQQVATMTGGQFFQAADLDAIRSIYTQIDALEKSLIQQKRFTEYEELYRWPAAAAILLLLFQYTLQQSIWLRIP